MPLFVAALVGALIQVCGTLVGRVLISLGISWVTYQGIDTSFSWIKDQIIANFSSLPTDVLTILSLAKVDVGINIVISALIARLTINGLTSGAVKRMVFK